MIVRTWCGSRIELERRNLWPWIAGWLRRFRILAPLVVVLFTGCASLTPEDVAEVTREAVDEFAAAAELAAADDDPGTDPWQTGGLAGLAALVSAAVLRWRRALTEHAALRAKNGLPVTDPTVKIES